jgi:hypothetical protein
MTSFEPGGTDQLYVTDLARRGRALAGHSQLAVS